jgi:hypothetical protein
MSNTKKQEKTAKPVKARENVEKPDEKKNKAGTGKGNVTIRPEQGPEVPPEEQTLGNP